MTTQSKYYTLQNQGLVLIDKNINFNDYELKSFFWRKYAEYLKRIPKETPSPIKTYVDFESFKITNHNFIGLWRNNFSLRTL